MRLWFYCLFVWAQRWIFVHPALSDVSQTPQQCGTSSPLSLHLNPCSRGLFSAISHPIKREAACWFDLNSAPVGLFCDKSPCRIAEHDKDSICFSSSAKISPRRLIWASQDDQNLKSWYLRHKSQNLSFSAQERHFLMMFFQLLLALRNIKWVCYTHLSAQV